LIEHSFTKPEEILSSHRVRITDSTQARIRWQIGNLASILFMKRLADAGHEIIFLAGGGTGMIGDPKEGGERPMQDEKIIEKNTQAIKETI